MRSEDEFKRTVCGVGYIGDGVYKVKVAGKLTKEYVTWKNMLQRVYNEKFQKSNKSYIGATVCDEWHNYQNFAHWYNAQKKEAGYVLDKDILAGGNAGRCYAPETTRLVPQEINNLLIRQSYTSSGLPVGVAKRKDGYVARIRINGGLVTLGKYETAELAYASYLRAKQDNIRRVAEKYRFKVCEDIYEALINYEVKPFR